MTSDNIQKYEEKILSLQKAKDDATRNYRELLHKNIDYLRKFHLQLTSISLIASGAILSIISIENQVIFMNVVLIHAGITCLLVSILLNVYYTNHILKKEHNSLISELFFYKDSFNSEIDKAVEYLNNKKLFDEYIQDHKKSTSKYILRENHRAESEKKNLDRFSDVLTWLFIIGLLLVIFSFKFFYHFVLTIWKLFF